MTSEELNTKIVWPSRVVMSQRMSQSRNHGVNTIMYYWQNCTDKIVVLLTKAEFIIKVCAISYNQVFIAHLKERT